MFTSWKTQNQMLIDIQVWSSNERKSDRPTEREVPAQIFSTFRGNRAINFVLAGKEMI